jgi:hypothetical protein
MNKQEDNPFDLWGKECWEVSGVKDYSSMFFGLIGLLPEASAMRLEGSSDGELVAFLKNHSIPERFPIPKGTIWPKQEIYNVPATPEILNKLSDLVKDVPGAEVAIHFHVYDAVGVLIDWYDAFEDPICISKRLSKVDINVFCERVGAEYKEHLDVSAPTVAKQSKLFKWFTKTIERVTEIVVLAAIWVLLGVGILFAGGYQSGSLLSWLVAIVALLVLYAASELTGAFVRGIGPIKSLRQSIDERTQGKSISVVRIAYLLAESSILIGVLFGCFWLILTYL